MKDIVNLVTALVFSGALFAGSGYTIMKIHDVIKKETLTQISKGLSSSEKLANSLTGERLDF